MDSQQREVSLEEKKRAEAMDLQQKEVSTLQSAAQELTIATEASQPCDEEKKRAEKAMDPQQREISQFVTISIKKELETFMRLHFEFLELHTRRMDKATDEAKVLYTLQNMRETANAILKRALEDFKEDKKKLETVEMIKTRIRNLRKEIRKLKNER